MSARLTDRPSVDHACISVVELDCIGSLVEHQCGPVHHHVSGLLGCPFHGHARNVRRARGICAGVKGGHIGVGGVDQDVLERHAENLGGNLSENGVGAGAEVCRAKKQVERAVVVDLDAGGTHVETGDGASVHTERKSDTATDVWAILWVHPFGVHATLPGDRSLALGDTLLDSAGRYDRNESSFCVAFAEFGRHIHGIARCCPVHLAELERVHLQLGSDVLHMRLEGKQRLRCSVSPIGTGNGNVGVDDVATEPLVSCLV